MAQPPQMSRSMLFRFMKRKSSFLVLLFCFTALIIYNMTSLSSPAASKPRHRNNILPDELTSKPRAKDPALHLNEHKPKHKGHHQTEDDLFEEAELSAEDVLANNELTVELHNSKLVKSFISELFALRPDEEILKENPLEFANFDAPEHVISYSYLNSLATIPKEWINEVKTKHSKVINLIKSKLSDFDLISSKDGAVIIGGADQDLTWLALISTRLFRRAGGVLPIEVMLPTRDDYIRDKEICDLYLPQLNAKCVIMKDLLETSKLNAGNIKINSYIADNFKLIQRELAILLSRFENVLYLSPENVMLKPMESAVFEKQFYKDYGLLIWGDYGPRFTLPTFYDVTNIEIKRTRTSIYGLPLTDELIKDKNLDAETFQNQINYHDMMNALPYKQSDASEIIINKKEHLSTLFLSMYYNLNGPKVYYILLTGKHTGDHGSKETILAASHVLNNKHYFVKTNVEGNGYWYDGVFYGVSMLQFDANVDFFSYEGFINKFANRKKGMDITQSKFQKWLKESSERRSPLFLNINNPPLRPVELIKEGTVVKENGDRVKLVSDSSYFDPLFETDIWRVMNDYICYLGLDANYVNARLGKANSKTRESFCKGEMKEHLLWIASLNQH